MKKTRKYKIVWTVVLITALLFSGCGKMKESASSVSAESDDEEYSVEILTPAPENGKRAGGCAVSVAFPVLPWTRKKEKNNRGKSSWIKTFS